MSKSNVSSSGIGLFGALGVAFIVLKLTDTIDWSWWWVTAPLWMPFTVCIVLAIAAMSWAGIQIHKENKGRQ